MPQKKLVYEVGKEQMFQKIMSERKALSDRARDAVLREAGYRCAVPTCHTILAMDIHHIVEVSKGGGNELSNLLALCPTCHALYHRGEITQESIRHWKTRLITLNQVVDVQAEIQKRADEIQNQKSERLNNGEQREGFALAVTEFLWRTCEAGFVDVNNRFVATGYCCFVGPKLAITSTEVADWAEEIGKIRGGSPTILTRRGLAAFTIKERFPFVNLVTIEMQAVDDRYVVEMLKTRDEFVARYFTAPLQTPVRFRIAPLFGERVGFLHSPTNSAKYRNSGDLQFDSADVAFHMAVQSEENLFEYVLTPVHSQIKDRGSPVFTADGRLVGIIRDTILLEGERAWRPVVCGAIPLRKLFN